MQEHANRSGCEAQSKRCHSRRAAREIGLIQRGARCAAAQRSRPPAGPNDETTVPTFQTTPLPCPVGKRHPHHRPLCHMELPPRTQRTAEALRHSPPCTRMGYAINRVVHRGIQERSPDPGGHRHNSSHTRIASMGYPPKSVDNSVDERQSARVHVQLVACRKMGHVRHRLNGAARYASIASSPNRPQGTVSLPKRLQRRSTLR